MQLSLHLRTSWIFVSTDVVAICNFYSFQLMDNLAGALDGVIFDLKEVCIFNIKATINSTGDNAQQQPDFVNRVLRQVQEVSCPGEPIACIGHGTCKKGRCECDAGELQVYVTVCFMLGVAYLKQCIRCPKRNCNIIRYAV